MVDELPFRYSQWSQAETVSGHDVRSPQQKVDDMAATAARPAPRRGRFATILGTAAIAVTSVLALGVADTVSAAGTGCPCSFWTEADTPGYTATDDLNAVELGLLFRSSEAVPVYGLRFYKSALNTGEHVGSLWTSSGELLARVTFTNETASGWQTAMFDTPVPTIAGVEYVVSYHAPNGGYSYDPQYFTASGLTRGILDVPGGGVPNGHFRYSPEPTFPDGSYNGNNYWIDPIVGSRSATGVTVSPASAEITVGGAGQALTANASYSDSTTADVTATAVWTSSNAAVATVDASGHVAAVAAGTATISATVEGVSGSSTITVKPAAVPLRVTSLTINPTSVRMRWLSCNQLTATATYNDGTTKVVTSQSAWTTSNFFSAIVTNPYRGSGGGTLISVLPGSATVRASYTENGVTVTASTLVTVTW